MLAVEGLTKRFGGFLAVNQVSFAVREGEILGLIGPNGSGKSTTFNLIAGTLKPTSGSVRFADTEIAGLSAHTICRRGIGRTFQIPRPFRKLSLVENRTHFTLWAMLAAPLLAGNDLTSMKPEIKAILTNRDVIAIDQDPLGRQGVRAYSDGEVEVWTRQLSGGAMAIAVLNVGSDRVVTHPFHLSLAKLGLKGPETGKDLWTGKDVTLTDNQSINLDSHDILLVRIASPK